MRKLKSNSDIIRATGAVCEPFFGDDHKLLEWLDDLPYNDDVSITDCGVYVTVQGMLVYFATAGQKTIFFPYVEIYRKCTDWNGHPCYQVRDVHGIDYDDCTFKGFSEVQYLWYDPDQNAIVLTDDDVTAA